MTRNKYASNPKSANAPVKAGEPFEREPYEGRHRIQGNRWAGFRNHSSTAQSIETRIALKSLLDSPHAKETFERAGIAIPLLTIPKSPGANNTDRCYLADQVRFMASCARDGNLAAVTEAQSLAYFEQLGTEELPTGRRRATTVYRAMAAVRKLYWEHALPSPTSAMSHRQLFRALARADKRLTCKARPLWDRSAVDLVEGFDQKTLRGLRNAAISAIAVNRGFRASTIVGLNIELIDVETRGLVFGIQYDKTHRSGEILRTPTKHTDDHRACAPCIVGRYKEALHAIGIIDGPLFRRIDRWGNLLENRLKPAAVTDILRSGLKSLGIADSETYSSHSFRHGVVHSGVAAGWTVDEICAVTLHRSQRGIMPYITAIDPWYATPKQIPLGAGNHVGKNALQGWFHANGR